MPEPERSIVDAVRTKCDPKQHSIIPAHATLCRDEEVERWDVIEPRLQALERIEIPLLIGSPRRTEEGEIYIPIVEGKANFDRLRKTLLLEYYTEAFIHITLVHSRNVSASDEMFESIRKEELPVSLTLREVRLIEQVNGGVWNTLASYPR